MSQSDLAVETVAKLYRHLDVNTELTHADISKLVTYFIALFFVEDSEYGDSWQGIREALDSHDRFSLQRIGSPIPHLAEPNGSFSVVEGRVWGLIDDCRAVNWNEVSPLVFGSAFQGIIEMDPKEITEELSHGGGKRREFGAHYTSKENIFKVINPLFLDGLVERSKKEDALSLIEEMSELDFFDPAVGCASFLVVIYQELRKLEMALLDRAGIKVTPDSSKISLFHFHGIEINPESAPIARLALTIAEQQMNADFYAKFGIHPDNHSQPDILVANALRVDWGQFLSPSKCNYIVGNPPFRGALKMTREQKQEMRDVGDEVGIKGAGNLDLVAAWFLKAAVYLQGGEVDDGMFSLWDDAPKSTSTKVAFVSTNSISQGSHIPNLWSWMFDHDIEIGFAYPSFRWENEADGHAAVTVVIVGFGKKGSFPEKRIFKEDGVEEVEYINGGLSSVNVGVVEPVKGRVLSESIPSAELGNLPRGKGFIVTPEQRHEVLVRAPQLEKWIPPFIGADELTKNGEQYCLWLVDAPQEVLDDEFISARVEDIRQQRLASTKKQTRDAATTAWLFDEIRQPVGDYLAIPTSSSGARPYIPMKFLPASTIASNALKTITGATVYHFGVLSSTMHMAWMRNTSARIGSGNDYSYSVASTYNTFPWPTQVSPEIEALAREILALRDKHSDIPLGKLYSNLPHDLREAHDRLDRAVDDSYGYTGDGTDESRFEFLFGLYTALSAPN